MIIRTLLVAVALGADAMSVCMGIGVRWHGPRQKFRMAWHMGLFQFLMPVLGWAIGTEMAGLLRTWGTYLAAALVFGVGLKMLYEALKSHPGDVAERTEHAAEETLHLKSKDPTRGWSLVVLSVATSLDALVVGFSLGLSPDGVESSLMGWQILIMSLVIGLVAATMALAGVIIGKTIGEKLGKPAEFIGAIILMALGVSFLVLK